MYPVHPFLQLHLVCPLHPFLQLYPGLLPLQLDPELLSHRLDPELLSHPLHPELLSRPLHPELLSHPLHPELLPLQLDPGLLSHPLDPELLLNYQTNLDTLEILDQNEYFQHCIQKSTRENSHEVLQIEQCLFQRHLHHLLNILHIYHHILFRRQLL